jgi:hypothetical protein
MAAPRPTKPVVEPPANFRTQNINTPIIDTIATAPAAAVPRLPASHSAQILTDSTLLCGPERKSAIVTSWKLSMEVQTAR